MKGNDSTADGPECQKLLVIVSGINKDNLHLFPLSKIPDFERETLDPSNPFLQIKSKKGFANYLVLMLIQMRVT